MSNDWQVPQIKDELERKTLETLDWIIERSSSGQMSAGECKVAVQTVFNITSGLVSPAVQSSLEVADADPMAETTLRRVFFGGPKVYVITWIVGSPEVFVNGVSLEKQAQLKAQQYPGVDAEAGWKNFNKLCSYMLNSLSLTEIV